MIAEAPVRSGRLAEGEVLRICHPGRGPCYHCGADDAPVWLAIRLGPPRHVCADCLDEVCALDLARFTVGTCCHCGTGGLAVRVRARTVCVRCRQRLKDVWDKFR